MTAATDLIDKARKTCSLPSDNALAGRMGISRQLLSGWRSGAVPMPDERIAQLATIAHEDAGFWLVRVRAEQDGGDVGRAWASLARKLGAAAALTLAVALPYQVSATASSFCDINRTGYTLREVLRRWITRRCASQAPLYA